MPGRLRLIVVLTAVLCGSALTSGCVTTSQAPVGVTHDDVFRFSNGRTFPLPEGDWTTVASVTRRNNQNVLLETVSLVRIEEGQVQGLLVARTNLDPAAGGWTTPRLCQRNDIHHIEVVSYNPRDASCWGVVHGDFTKQFTGYWGEVLNPYLQYLKERTVAAPPAMIDAEFYEARESRFLELRYYRNPEAAGFPSPGNADWARSDWNIQNVAADPEKAAYVQELIAWAKGRYPRVRASL